MLIQAATAKQIESAWPDCCSPISVNYRDESLVFMAGVEEGGDCDFA